MKKSIRRVLRKKLSASIFLMLLTLGVFCFYYSFAQEVGVPTTGVQVSPVRFDWDLNDGDERTGVINLKNYSEKSEYLVTVELEDFYVSDDSSEARFFVPNATHPLFAYDVINWIEISKEIKLAPKEGKDIFFKVKVPEGTPTGGYYGALFFKTRVQDVGGEASTKVLINQRVGVLLIMAVKGDQPIRLSGELKEFKATRKIFWTQPAELRALVYNSGNLPFRALGSMEISKFGRKIWSQNITSRVFYPEKLRELTESWDFSTWSFGFYRAKLDLASEDQNIKLLGETTFWVIPWKTLLAIIILLLAIWLTYKLFSDKFEIRRKEDKTENSN